MGRPERDSAVIAGRYRLGPLIGRGGMGEVYDAWHLMTGRSVALKLVRGDTLADIPGAEARVLHEAGAVGSLRHPGIVEILDAGWTERGDLFLVFERLEGQSLERAFRQRRVPPRDLVRVGARLLDALGAVHGAGWVHRDVKPANVFLARDLGGRFEVKLLDFGIAVRIGEIPDERSLVGTLEYMSPEQALGRPAGPRSDLWAVGALLFRGLIGRPPCPARLPEDRARWLQSPVPDPARYRPELPRGLASAVRRALHPHPSERWADAEQFASALRGLDDARLDGLAPPSIVTVDEPPTAVLRAG